MENTRLRVSPPTASRYLLLTTDRSVKEVAYATGFEDPLYFSHEQLLERYLLKQRAFLCKYAT